MVGTVAVVVTDSFLVGGWASRVDWSWCLYFTNRSYRKALEANEEAMTETKLPSVPSQLIRLALADLEKCEADKTYRISMGNWHNGDRGDRCLVCLAGSVMAKSLNAKCYEACWPADFGSEAESCLLALNDFRRGYVDVGVLELGHAFPFGTPKIMVVEEYYINPTAFKHDMNTMADMLEGHGL